jgi:hypothetical protein
MQHIKENQNLCIQVIKVNFRKTTKKKLIFVFLDLTPPMSADLADKFRQTIILVSDKSTSVRKKKKDKRFDFIQKRLYFFSQKNKCQIVMIMIKYHHQLLQDQKKPKAL